MKTIYRINFPFTLIVLFLQMSINNNLQAQPGDTRSINELGSPPGSYKILSDNERIIIPFEFYRNKLRFKALIEGLDCNLLLDNGSLWDELLFFGSPKVDSMGFKYTGETNIGNSKADITTDVSVRFNDVMFDNQTAVVTRYDRNLPNLWEGFDGQISATFFKHFVVKLNFDDSTIELIPPKKFKYTGKGQEISMKPGPYNSRTVSAEITMQNGATNKIDLQIDLGGLHPIYLPVGKDEKITLPSNAIESSLGIGLFAQNGYMGRVQSVRFGDYSLKNVLTAFQQVDKNANIYGNTMIGLPLLQRFNIIFDYFNNRIILEPSKTFNMPFKFSMTGLELRPNMQGNLQVTKVYPNSPAFEAKIYMDDIITHINGTMISQYKPGEIRTILKQESELVTFDILRQNESKKITIRLRQIL